MTSDTTAPLEDARIHLWLEALRDGTPVEQTQARRGLARVFEQRGMLEEATDLLIANVQAGERNADTYRWLARLYRDQGQEVLATQAAAEAAKYLPARPPVVIETATSSATTATPMASEIPPGRTALAKGGSAVGGCVTVIITIVGLVIGGVVVLAIIGSLLPKSPLDGWDAQATCRDFVRDRLRAPSTASFASSSADKATKNADGSFTVRSYVDSQNGFGAMIRTAYVCHVRPSNDQETWFLISIEM